MTFSEQFISILDVICARVGVAIDWTSANVLPYLEILCKKFISYEIATSVFWLIVGSILFYLMIKMFGITKNYIEQDADIEIILAGLVTIVFGGISIPMIIIQVLEILTCITFPEKILFEYISTLVQ